jgi:predicted metal-dependent hydrolase
MSQPMEAACYLDIKIKRSPKITLRFDPFTDRLSRDIRNCLSTEFVRSLNLKRPELYRNAGHELLKKNLASIYRDYIHRRLQRYDSVFEQIEKHQTRIIDSVLTAIVIWNYRLFFEVHEQLEGIWHQSRGEQRQALGGLIKAAGAYIHMEQGHQQAASRLASKSYELLTRHRDFFSTIGNLNDLLDKLKAVDPDPPRLYSILDQ